MTYAAGFICASLPDQLERRRRFAVEFAAREQFEFVDSIDGRSWSIEEADKFVSDHLRAVRQTEREKGKTWLNEAAVACALTHRDKLLVIAEQRDVFLCEDDAVIGRDLIDAFQQPSFRNGLRQLNGPVLAHYLAHVPILTDESPVIRLGRFGVYRLTSSHIMSGACYYASPTVAGAIRKAQTPINYAADLWLNMRRDGAFADIFLLHPRPCNTAGFYSTIGYRKSTLFNSNHLVLRALRKLNRKLWDRKLNAHHAISNLPEC
jgi:hypothetical protein